MVLLTRFSSELPNSRFRGRVLDTCRVQKNGKETCPLDTLYRISHQTVRKRNLTTHLFPCCAPLLPIRGSILQNTPDNSCSVCTFHQTFYSPFYLHIGEHWEPLRKAGKSNSENIFCSDKIPWFWRRAQM